MKKKLKIFVLATVAILLGTRCEDFLVEDPRFGLLESNFFTNDEEALSAVYAAYDPLQFQQGAEWHFRWVYGDIVSDDSDKGGSNVNDIVQWFRLAEFQGTGANTALLSEWTAKFAGIARANFAIVNIEGNEQLSESLRPLLIAEAKFLRAFYYFNLVTIFGGVPINEAPLNPSEFRRPKNTEEEVWAFIIQDLEDAISVLPTKSTQGAALLGRANKGAAQGLLAKSYVYTERWAEAKQMTETIINSGEYSLSADYEDIFSEAGEHGPGSLFEINFTSATNVGWEAGANGGEGNLTNIFQTSREVTAGRVGFGFNIPTQNFVDEFESNDPRLTATVFRDGDQMGGKGVHNATEDFPFLARKYFLDAAIEDGAVPELNGPSNERVIRYADVLLWHAEASFQTSDESAARASLNEVRARARRNAPVGTLPDVTAGGADLLNAIYHERRVELGLEGHRFFDLVRTGRAGEVMRAQGFNFIDGTHELFPIPDPEIIASNFEIIQNPGYN